MVDPDSEWVGGCFLYCPPFLFADKRYGLRWVSESPRCMGVEPQQARCTLCTLEQNRSHANASM